jgi:ABC-type Zn uptake system ZnuABC Zn-binding protein ZnuA
VLFCLDENDLEWRMKKMWILVLVALPLVGCGVNQPAADAHPHEMTLPEVTAVDLAGGEKLAVVATTSIIGDVAANVGGDAIDLIVLIGIGQDPHSFEPTPRDLAAIEDADVIFANGLDLEEALLGAIENTASGVVVPVSAGIELVELESEDEDEEEHDHAADPHFWVDPNNVIVWVENIRAVLSQADPANGVLYLSNAAGYIGELHALDQYIREQVAHIPAERRKLVTDHDTFGYFAGEYGFEIIGAVIPNVTTTSGGAAGGVADLVRLIESESVPAVFIGSTASLGTRQLTEALAEEIGEEVAVLPLLSGSLAPAGETGDTYLGYMRYNIDQIVRGLAVGE